MILVLLLISVTATARGDWELRATLFDTVCFKDVVRLAGSEGPDDKWISSDPAIASCDVDGNIHGVSPGAVTIYHSYTFMGRVDTNTHLLTVMPEGQCLDSRIEVGITPIPGNGTVTVSISSPVDEWAKTLLVDAAGSRVVAYLIMTNRITDMPVYLQTGLYFLIVETNNVRVVKRVLVENY